MAVVQLEISRRSPYAGGKTFGDVGAYEQIDGTVHYAVDPLHSANDGIVDLELAPRDSSGKVWFASDFTLLKPENMENGNGSVLYDVVNRGRKTVMGRFNDTGKPTMPSDPLDAGNGFLMRHGYSVLFGGWQADVPRGVGLIGLQAPEAVDAGRQPHIRQDYVPVPGDALHAVLPARRQAARAASRRRRERGGRHAHRARPSQQPVAAHRPRQVALHALRGRIRRA